MKFLIALLFLINCLAFFMLQHIQKQSELLAEQSISEQDAVLESPKPIALLSELSAEQLEALNPEPVIAVEPTPLESEPTIEGETSLLVDPQ